MTTYLTKKTTQLPLNSTVRLLFTLEHPLEQKGKANKVILVACMRKLLVMLNAMMRDQTPWHVLEKKT